MTTSPKILRIKRLYVCDDPAMKSVMSTAWGFYLEYQEELVKFNSAYTKEYGEEQLKAIVIATKMGDHYSMRSPSIVLRLKMDIAGKTCARNFRVAKRYICHLGYEGTVLKKHYTQAGQSYFKKATNQNWKSMEN